MRCRRSDLYWSSAEGHLHGAPLTSEIFHLTTQHRSNPQPQRSNNCSSALPGIELSRYEQRMLDKYCIITAKASSPELWAEIADRARQEGHCQQQASDGRHSPRSACLPIGLSHLAVAVMLKVCAIVTRSCCCRRLNEIDGSKDKLVIRTSSFREDNTVADKYINPDSPESQFTITAKLHQRCT